MKRSARILYWALPATAAPIIVTLLVAAPTYWWTSRQHPQEELDGSIGAFFGVIAICASFIVAGAFALMTTFQWQEASVSERISGLAPLTIGLVAVLMIFVFAALSI